VAAVQPTKEPKLDLLPFPLKNTGRLHSENPTEMLSLDLIGKGLRENRSSVIRPSADYALARIGEIEMVATRTTPCISIADDPKHITMAMLYAGERYRYQQQSGVQHIEPGSIHVCQRTGGAAHIGYFSGIICEIDRLRLERTMRALGREEFKWNSQKSYVLRKRGSHEGRNTQRHLWSLLAFVDELLGESEYLATGLGLDEQVYRLLAMSLFQEEGVLENTQEQWGASTKQWTDKLDDLVDYIHSNAHLNLTLTDLEERSHYSGRQLQNLFREKFDCTPLQFVRRQRLSTAMEKLQTAGLGDTVTTIARDMGYRYTSSFSCDFQREFGVSPSVVLRSSRRGKGHSV
jgi:AraC-like DNA-binding protein